MTVCARAAAEVGDAPLPFTACPLPVCKCQQPGVWAAGVPLEEPERVSDVFTVRTARDFIYILMN